MLQVPVYLLWNCFNKADSSKHEAHLQFQFQGNFISQLLEMLYTKWYNALSWVPMKEIIHVLLTIIFNLLSEERYVIVYSRQRD